MFRVRVALVLMVCLLVGAFAVSAVNTRLQLWVQTKCDCKKCGCGGYREVK